MMTPGPTVSVLMPVYSARAYLAEAVRSVLGQTFSDFELIAIDDGSTDDSLDILRRETSGHSRVRIVSRPNTGYSPALNEALALATGRYVARMDADDVAMPRRFELQVAGWMRNRNWSPSAPGRCSSSPAAA